MDLGHTMGRMSLYEKSVALFWVMKNLVGRAKWDRESPILENSSLDSWKNAILTMIHSLEVSVKRVEDKNDFLTTCLGFQFSVSLGTNAIKPSCPSSSQHFSQDLSYILL